MVHVAWALIVGSFIALALAAWDRHKCYERQQAQALRWRGLALWYLMQYWEVMEDLTTQTKVVRGLQKTLTLDARLLTGADNLLRNRCEACEIMHRDAC